MTAYDAWSNDAQGRTRAALDQLAFISNSESLGLKHTDGRFGTILVKDILAGKTRVKDQETEREESFATVEDLIRAGWVID
jgi:hypothetical protein